MPAPVSCGGLAAEKLIGQNNRHIGVANGWQKWRRSGDWRRCGDTAAVERGEAVWEKFA
jgi:hypothetical protein